MRYFYFYSIYFFLFPFLTFHYWTALFYICKTSQVQIQTLLYCEVYLIYDTSYRSADSTGIPVFVFFSLGVMCSSATPSWAYLSYMYRPPEILMSPHSPPSLVCLAKSNHRGAIRLNANNHPDPR